MYTIERELGGGGMGRVFLATETALSRRVVVKVLSPEVGAEVSGDRFQREIQVAARLQHPHIVPLLTAGRAGDFLYYTMPYIEGESLRARFAREGELPVPDVVRILTGTARALAYAHRQGIVHRDIKPDNILLAEGEAQVTDFGIAKALSVSTEGATLTAVGLALGTPAYMAPEQASADQTADHRVDLYALGVVGYEMLAGQPPFSARTVQQMLAAHATEMPVPVEQRRPAVPPPLAQLIAQLLAKRPADRPSTAGEVVTALQTVATPHSVPTIAVARHRSLHRGRWLVAGGITGLALALSLAWLHRDRPSANLDRRTIAIAPFRVTGADSSLRYLREGMVDLLAAKLSGTSDLRPADPRTLLSKWARAAGKGGDLAEEDALRVAAASGAGRVVEGEVVGNGARLTLAARILDVPGGTVRARATVEGTPDSLTQLVDRLAASLLALGAGEAEQRLAGLTSTSLPALRAYLDGESLLRRGAFVDAAARFGEAFQLDSNFALAGLGQARALEWVGDQDVPARAAWYRRERLSPRDRAYLDTYLGPRFPAPPGARETIEVAERFVSVAPDSPDAWYKLADNLFHYGPLSGIPEAHQRAAAAFARSLALDSSYAPTIQHLSEMAAALGDSAGVRRGRELLHRIDSASTIAAARRWHVAAFLGDTTEIRAALATDSVLDAGPFYIVFYSLDTPLDLTGTEAVYPRALGRAATRQDRENLQATWNRYELIQGRPRSAPPLPEKPALGAGRNATGVLDWIFADGDSAIAATAAKALKAQLGRPLHAGEGNAVLDRYAAGQYALAEGRKDLVRQAISDLLQARTAPDSAWQNEDAHLAALLLRVQLAAIEDAADAPELLQQLDTTLRNPNPVVRLIYESGNLIVARLYETSGNLPGALAAVRRRLFGISWSPMYVQYHALEGRLAALTGDRDGALVAYRRYLAVRSDPEPRLLPQADSIRAELAALLRESSDR